MFRNFGKEYPYDVALCIDQKSENFGHSRGAPKLISYRKRKNSTCY